MADVGGCLVHGDPRVKYQPVATSAANAGGKAGKLERNLAVGPLRRIETTGGRW